MRTSTRNQYKKLLSQFKRWSILELGQSDLTGLTQTNVENYELYLVNERRLSPRSVNNHRQAINKFYKAHSLDIRLTLRSVPISKTAVETIGRKQMRLIIDTIPNYYRPIIRMIYIDLVPPGLAVKQFPSPGGHINLQAVNNQLAAAANRLGIVKRVRAKMLHQSGIIHRLEDDDPAVVRELTGLRPSTIARYLKYTGK